MKSNLLQKATAAPTEEKVRLRQPQLNLEAYQNEWVALSPDGSRVIAHDAKLDRCDEAVEAAGESPEEAIFEWVRPKGVLHL